VNKDNLDLLGVAEFAFVEFQRMIDYCVFLMKSTRFTCPKVNNSSSYYAETYIISHQYYLYMPV
jgi:hypothetical protein